MRKMNNKLYALLGSSMIFASCQKQDAQDPSTKTEQTKEKITELLDAKNPSAPTPASSSSATSSGLNPANQILAKHLDMHGQSISLSDQTEAWESTMSVVEGFEKVLRENERNFPKGLSLVNLIKKTKINEATKFGSSLLKVEGGYLNKNFIDLGGTRSGIFSMFDGRGDTWTVADFAPSGADYVNEFDLKVENFLEVFDFMAEGIDPGMTGKIRGEMEKAIAENPQLAEVAKGIHLRVSTVFKTIEGETMTSPQGITLPKIEGTYRVKGLNTLFSQVAPMLEEQMVKEEQNGLVYYSPKEKIPQEMSDAGFTYHPVLVVDNVNEELWVSTNKSFFEECLSGEAKLKDDAEFKNIMGSLEAGGNMLEYVSHDMIKHVHTLYVNHLAPLIKSEAKKNETGLELAMINHVLSIFENKIFPALLNSKEGFATVLTLNEDGLLLAMKTPIAFNISTSYTQVAMIAGLAAVSSPIIIRQKTGSRAPMVITNGKDIYVGMRDYAFKNGGQLPEAGNIRSSNEYFKAFFESGSIVDDSSFYVKGVPGAAAPNGNKQLESGENVFGVIPGVNITNDSANTPVLIAPFAFGELDPEGFSNQIAIVTSDGAASIYNANSNTEIYDDHGNLIYKDGYVYYQDGGEQKKLKVLAPE